jgi:hypothetical protein
MFLDLIKLPNLFVAIVAFEAFPRQAPAGSVTGTASFYS